MLDLRDVLELVVDALDDSALAQHDLVHERHQSILHPPLELRHELHAF